ncbi:MAG: hypothetical protein ACO1NX_02305 [Chitinophagaceae bacterium]
MLILFLGVRQTAAQRLFAPVADSSNLTRELPLLPQNFYNQHLGFFCKKENQLQKVTKLNVYFRFGSKNYVDYLEKKPNAVWIER